MNYHWKTYARAPQQHWLHTTASLTTVGLVYEVRPGAAYSVYGESFEKNPYARVFLGMMPTLDEAKDLLLTITASQNI